MINNLLPVSPIAPSAPLLKPSTESSAGGFAAELSSALQQVNNLQLRADELATQLATGQIDDVHQVTIAMTQAQLSLQLAVQVRNKMVEAYQEISRMQV